MRWVPESIAIGRSLTKTVLSSMRVALVDFLQVLILRDRMIEDELTDLARRFLFQVASSRFPSWSR